MYKDDELDKIKSFFDNSSKEEEICGLKVIKKLDDARIGGVWALFGKKNEKSNWICLQTGHSKNMYQEIKLDVIYMKSKPNMKGKEVDYINQCGKRQKFEEGYEIKSFPSVREQVYSYIGNKYVDLTFVLVYDATNAEDNKQREKVEKYFAYSTESLYWKNGGNFKTPGKCNMNEIMGQIELEIPENDEKVIKKCISKFNQQKNSKQPDNVEFVYSN